MWKYDIMGTFATLQNLDHSLGRTLKQNKDYDSSFKVLVE